MSGRKPTAEELRQRLSSLQYHVTQEKGTERAFTGKYHAHAAAGTYVCVCCGTELFRSDTKFDAHCGWPAFDDEIPGAVKRLPDPDGLRTEIECAKCGAHLGHDRTDRGRPRDTRALAVPVSQLRPASGPVQRPDAVRRERHLE